MTSGFRRIWPYDPTHPPSGAIPRFPVWEVTAMLAVIFVGTTALLDPTAGRLTSLIGSSAMLFYSCLILGGVAALIGMLMRAPGGLLVQLFAHSVLAVVSAAIGIGIGVDLGKMVYSGSSILYVLTVGGTWRAGQLLGQLWRGLRASQEMARRAGR